MKTQGLTLVELLIVVVIIGILATIAVPGYDKSIRHARGREAQSTLRLIYNAEKMYHIDHETYSNGGTPDQDFEEDALGQYMENPNLTNSFYEFSVTAAAANTFTARATPQEAGLDTFEITQAGSINEL